MNIFLLGFMGSGKSTIGKLLSSDLKTNFIDIDHVIEEKYKKTIGEIFSKEGEEKFRLLENDIITTNFTRNSEAVVSVGGGLPCFHNNMETMNNLGTTIYLKMSAQAIFERLWLLPEAARAQRPLLANKSKTELLNYIEQTLTAREPFYNKAKLIISNETFDATITLARIKMALSYL
jgi:shikimate kinase